MIGQLSIDYLWGVVLIGSFVGALIWCAWVVFNRRRWGYAVAPISWLVHCCVYFTVRTLFPLDPNLIFQLWSVLLIGHGVGILIGIGIAWLRFGLPRA